MKIADDEYLKHLKLLTNEEDLTTIFSSSQTPSRNGSMDGRLYPNIKPEGFDDTSEFSLFLSGVLPIRPNDLSVYTIFWAVSLLVHELC